MRSTIMPTWLQSLPGGRSGGHGQQRVARLRRDLAEADSYDSWQAIALELDELLGLEEWKLDNVSDLYDYRLLSERLGSLRRMRLAGEDIELMRALREGLNHDLGNMGHPLLYGHSYIGTKYLIENYIDEVCQSLAYLQDQPVAGISDAQKLRFFEETAHSYGQPALMFSGGATLGLFHVGVAKALHEQQLLPRVFSGSSAGSIMAGMLGTHTDDEILQMASGEGVYEYAFRIRQISEILRGGGIADVMVLKHFLRQNLGEYTFEEAFQRFGRHVNIVVAPYDSGQHARIMNELTSPYLLMWSASLASCAVPVLFPPVRLTAKDHEGRLRPYMAQTRWVDGSIHSDFPQARLSRLYNINYTIAVQVNPHIVPFVHDDHTRSRSDLAAWPTRAARRQGQMLAQNVMEFARDTARRWPEVHRMLDQGRGILGQQYYGDINIVASYSPRHYTYTLQNLSKPLLRKLSREGERATWPMISRIRTHARIGKQLEQGVAALQARVA